MKKCKGQKCEYWRWYFGDGLGPFYNTIRFCCRGANSRTELNYDEGGKCVIACENCFYKDGLDEYEKVTINNGIIRKYPVYVNDCPYTAFITEVFTDNFEIKLCKGKWLTPKEAIDLEDQYTVYFDVPKFECDFVKMVKNAVELYSCKPSSDKMRALEEWNGRC